MTLRLTLGFDPGVTGAIVVLADGEPVRFEDMPTRNRAGGGREIDVRRLAALLRGILQQHTGAAPFAVLEEISMRPTNSRNFDQRVGEGFGILKGVLGSLAVDWTEVRPQTWKRWFGLIGTEKDDARLMVLRDYPQLRAVFGRKKDIGRADALLIARWGHATEAHVPRPFALSAPKVRAKRRPVPAVIAPAPAREVAA